MPSVIVNMNLTDYMGPDRSGIINYVKAVTDAVSSARYEGPFTSVCPECGRHFEDIDEAFEDDEHMIIMLTSDTTAVIVGCEGYFVVNPNLVGIDSPNWSDGTALGDEATGVGASNCPGRPHRGHTTRDECPLDR